MGYTTKFKGQFMLNAPMRDLEVFDLLQQWSDDNGPIGGYCQWVLTEDRTGIEWDGEEKFYNYVKWLQTIIDVLLLPRGYSLAGEVEFQGEDVADHGRIYIDANNQVQIRKRPKIPLTCPHCGRVFELTEAKPK